MSRVLNSNIVTVPSILKRPIRMWIEGLIFGLIGVLIIRSIPFVTAVKILLSIITFLTLFTLNLVGFKNRSWTQCVVAVIKHRHRKRRLHLRSPEYVKSIKYEEDIENESLAEEVTRKAKQRIDGFIEKHRTK